MACAARAITSSAQSRMARERKMTRHHAAVVAFAVGIALFALFLTYRRRPETPVGRLAVWALLALTVAFPVVLVGGFEGLYNHVAKNVLFLSGASTTLLSTLFPPPRYEMPNDLL